MKRFKITITQEGNKDFKQEFFCEPGDLEYTVNNDLQELPKTRGMLEPNGQVSKGFSFSGTFKGYLPNKNFKKEFDKAIKKIFSKE
jgi:hypothetical protein